MGLVKVQNNGKRRGGYVSREQQQGGGWVEGEESPWLLVGCVEGREKSRGGVRFLQRLGETHIQSEWAADVV